MTKDNIKVAINNSKLFKINYIWVRILTHLFFINFYKKYKILLINLNKIYYF